MTNNKVAYRWWKCVFLCPMVLFFSSISVSRTCCNISVFLLGILIFKSNYFKIDGISSCQLRRNRFIRCEVMNCMILEVSVNTILIQRCLKIMFALLVILVNHYVVLFAWTLKQFYLCQSQVDWFQRIKTFTTFLMKCYIFEILQLSVVTDQNVSCSSSLNNCDIIVVFECLLQEMFYTNKSETIYYRFLVF